MRSAPYQALRETAAWINLTGRGHLRVSGEDRARLLHAMTTNHIQELQPGDGVYAFFLNAQGRILADVNVLCGPQEFVLDTDPGTRQTVSQHLEKFIIADDATVQDLSDRTAVLAVEGPKAAEYLVEMGVQEAPAPFHWVPWNTWIVAGLTHTGLPGYRFFGPSDATVQMQDWFGGMGLVEAGQPETDTVRLELAHPLYGADFNEHHIPHEAQLLGAVHFNKGCYLGQEIVERVRSRGRVNRKLVHLRIPGRIVPIAQAKLMADGKEAGQVMSAAYSPAEGCVFAFAYLRTGVPENAPIEVAGGGAVELTGRVPA